MGDIWMGHEHIAERRLRFRTLINGVRVSPFEVAAKYDPTASEARIELGLDRKDLWHEFLMGGPSQEALRDAVEVSSKNLRRVVEFTLTGLSAIVGRSTGWQDQMMEHYLEFEQSWYPNPPPIPVRRFLGIPFAAGRRPRTIKWYWTDVLGVREDTKSIMIDGLCVQARPE